MSTLGDAELYALYLTGSCLSAGRYWRGLPESAPFPDHLKLTVISEVHHRQSFIPHPSPTLLVIQETNARILVVVVLAVL